MNPTELDPLLRPRSIALLGVSRETSAQPTMSGSTILESLQRLGFGGRIDLVHPSGGTLRALPAAPSIAALPQPADLLLLALPAAAVPSLVAEAGQRGIRAAVVLSAGFAELADEEGERLGRELQQAAAAHGLPLCGPNGLGYLNVWDRVLAGYFPCLLGEQRPRPGGLSVVTQSGAIGNSLLARAMDRRIGTSFVISAGNETNVSVADYVDFLVADPKTEVIAIYLEGVVDGARLRRSLQRAVAAGKPVVVYKVGKSAFGARAALSHTAKVAGEPALYRGLFRQLGVIEAQHLDDLIEIPMLLLKSAPRAPRPPRGIGVVSISGGLGAIMADHFAAEGFTLPELSAATQAKLAALPLKLGSTLNPVDTTAAIQRNEQALVDILKIVADDQRVDALVFPNAARFPGPALNVATLMAQTAAQLGKPLLSVWYAGHENEAAMARLHESADVPCFDDPAACARALAALRDVRQHAGAEPPPVSAPPGSSARAAVLLQGYEGVLDEAQGKRLLAAYGVALLPERHAADADAAGRAAAELGLPVAMKILSADIPHKAKAGGVALGLASPQAVAEAWAAMMDRVRRHAPAARIDGVLVSPMAAIELELLAGAYRDPQFGPVLVVGIGGAQVESRPDVAMRLLPVSAADCRAALDELQDRRVALLDEERKAVLAAAVARIAALAWDLRDQVAEIDVNPLALTRGEALALDALVRLAGFEQPTAR
ncbi:MAG: acetate--CoA ligase family protein [Rubrivivax sp.]